MSDEKENISPVTCHSSSITILVAGVGNIFFGDDAFGCEVVKALLERPPRAGVRIEDFGIRSYDLAYAMMEDYHAIILVDAIPRGEKPGTVYLIEPDTNILDSAANEVVNAHTMNPQSVLQMVRALGGTPRQVFVIGCEPAILESKGQLGLSDVVRNAIPATVEMIGNLIGDLLGKSKDSHTTIQIKEEPI